MTVNRTTLLDLPLPVTGTESGTWGDTTNNGLTQYMDIAIAGMSNLTSANFTTGALTIETTEGNSSATNITATSGQYAGFRVTSLAQNSTITVGNTGTNPARSYRLINADATYTLTFKATGQTGITLQPGQTAVVAFNGTDYVIVGMAGAGTVTDNAVVRFDGTTGKLVQNSVVTIADSTGDVAGVGALTMGGNLTLNGGTANGVLYLNGSKVATSGSALTFDGTSLGVGQSSPSTFNGKLTVGNGGTSEGITIYAGATGVSNGALYFAKGTTGTQTYAGYVAYFGADDSMRFAVAASEQMRLTSTGLGIGTSSPGAKLDVRGYGGGLALRLSRDPATDILDFYQGGGVSYIDASLAGTSLAFATGGTSRMRLDSSGNLGLGVTPSAWAAGTYKGLEVSVGNAASVNLVGGDASLMSNAYISAIGTSRYLYSSVGATKYQFYNGTHAWFTAPSGTAGNAITFSQAMTLDASGNLSVGTTTIATQITFAGGSGITYQRSTDNTFAGVLDYLKSRGSAASPTAVQNGDDLFVLRVAPYHGSAYTYLTNTVVQVDGTFTSGQNPPTRIAWYTNAANGGATERARITSGGDLLVGTTNAAENAGSGMKVLNTGGTVALVSTASDASQQGFEMYSTTAAAYRLYINYAGTINATSTTISAISDQRLKENIQDLDVGLDKIMALKPRKFDWKTGKGKDIKGDRGWIAQEFEQVFPDLIDEWRDPAPEGEEPYKSVRADLIPILVKAIQEQQALITSLTARVALLEGN